MTKPDPGPLKFPWTSKPECSSELSLKRTLSVTQLPWLPVVIVIGMASAAVDRESTAAATKRKEVFSVGFMGKKFVYASSKQDAGQLMKYFLKRLNMK